jgi:hypothetical protein
MKKPLNPVIPDYTPKNKKKEEETKIDLKPCLICNKSISDGYYGSWGDGGVCSKTCNTAQSLKPKYPGHTEADFFARLAEGLSDYH